MGKCYSFFGAIGSQWVPCPSGAGCCVSGDTCLSNNICQYGSTPTGLGVYSGYYAATCTDSTFLSPYCPQDCTNSGQPDIVYNGSSSQWHCCESDGSANVFCNHPKSVIFPAPAPEKLTVLEADGGSSGANVSSITISTSSTSAIAQTSGSHPTSNPTANSNSKSHSNSVPQSALSAGTQAVIGILASFTILFFITLVAGGIYFLCCHSYLRSKQSGQPYPQTSFQHDISSVLGSGHTLPVCEKCNSGMIHEIDSRCNFRSEICGNGVARYEMDHTNELHLAYR